MNTLPWVEDVTKGQKGVCPVCRTIAEKTAPRQTGCGKKACRDAGYKMRQAGIDPKTPANPNAAGQAEKTMRHGGLHISESQKFKALQKAAGNAVAYDDKPKGGFILADKTLVTYAEARALLNPAVPPATMTVRTSTGDKLCAHCGKPFTSDDPAHGYCSDACGQARWKTAPEPAIIAAVAAGTATIPELANAHGLTEQRVQAVVDAAVMTKQLTPAQALAAESFVAATPAELRQALVVRTEQRAEEKGEPTPPAPPAPPAPPSSNGQVGATSREKAVASARWTVASVEYEEAGEALLAHDRDSAAELAELKARIDAKKAELKAAHKAAEAALVTARKKAQALGLVEVALA